MSRYTRAIICIAGLCCATVSSLGTTYADEASRIETSNDQRKFYVEDIKSTMMKHIAAKVDDKGIFHLRDDKTGEQLALKFVRIHDPVRQIGSDVYFACTDSASW